MNHGYHTPRVKSILVSAIVIPQGNDPLSAGSLRKKGKTCAFPVEPTGEARHSPPQVDKCVTSLGLAETGLAEMPGKKGLAENGPGKSRKADVAFVKRGGTAVMSRSSQQTVAEPQDIAFIGKERDAG